MSNECKVVIIVGSFSRKGGGVYEVVRNALLHLGGRVKFDVICVRDEFSSEDVPAGVIADFHYLKNSFDVISILKYLFLIRPSVIHLHGLWMRYDLAILAYCAMASPRLFITPHGMLEKWILKNNRFKKFAFFNLVDKWLLKKAESVFVLTEKELADVNAVCSDCRNKVFVLPNPIPIPDCDQINDVSSRYRYLYLGRLHPKKNIVNLLNGWSCFVRNHPGDNLELEIVGWGDASYVDKLHEFIQFHGLEKSVYLRGPFYGEEKKRAFASARFFLLPSLSEGLPMAPLEALSYGCFPMLSVYCNLEDLFEHGFAYKIGVEVIEIASSLEKSLNFSDIELQNKIFESRSYLEKNYSEEQIGNLLVQFYKGQKRAD